MKTEKRILTAFLLNLLFSVFEFIGGLWTGSVAILSDAIHDMGDAATIGVSYFLEKKSKLPPDEKYTYGYERFSVIGGAISSLVLLLGSAAVIYSAIMRIIHPSPIRYDGMILFAVIGICVNFAAAYITHDGASLNQKVVSLHMLEDLLGWVVVLIGALVMRFTNLTVIDPIMSMGIAVFILINASRYLKDALCLFLEKVPRDMDAAQIKEHLLGIDGVLDVHHIHIWSMDEHTNLVTMHIVTNGHPHSIKDAVRAELKEHGITHATLELEEEEEHCHETHCGIESGGNGECHHHHHHHHHHH